MSRWVTYGDSKTINCRMFSFDTLPRQVTAQPCMLESGTYEITLHEDNESKPGALIFSKQQKLKRFDTFTFEVPSFKPVLLTVKQLKKAKNQGPYPDIAITGDDCERVGSTLKVRISNVGAAKSQKTSIIIYDIRGEKISEKSVPVINAPIDYTEKSVIVKFSGIPTNGALRIVMDEKNRVEEIYEGNNEIILK